jgi:hypothetical protein
MLTQLHIMRWIACAWLASCASLALQAREILFVDLNNAQAEIAAIRAGMRPDDQLSITPSSTRLDAKARAAVLDLKRRHDIVELRARNCTMKRRAECEALWMQMKVLDREREALIGAFDVEAMIADIRLHADRAFDVVVISGHHSGSYFRGEIGALDANDLLRIAFELPQQFASVRSVILLGCETGVPSLVGDLFMKVFPNAALIIGAEDNAPLRDEHRNQRFVRALIAQEPALAASGNKAPIVHAHRSWMNERWPVAILWQREHYLSKEWSGRLTDMPERVAKSYKISAETLAANSPRIAPAPAPAYVRGTVTPPTRPKNSNHNEPLLSPSDAARLLRD